MTREEKREYQRLIGAETRLITGARSYTSPSGKNVRLEGSLEAVELYPPERSAESVARAEELKAGRSEACRFWLADIDSYAAAERLKAPLVMNFASAHRPGGGFLTGATAQEEALCRTSTLYASISCDEAAAMYDYNNSLHSDVDSDYFLISPDVLVFRNSDLSLREEPFRVSVVTIAAPNRRGRAADVKKSRLDEVMTVRLRKMLYTAADRGYRDLVLGAWGCGAFRNDPKDVSEYFRKLFIDENIAVLFDNVIFAVLGGGDNYNAFAKAFAGRISGKLPSKIS